MDFLKPLMDKNFLEYASYVIKDRAIPDIDDGLKPVQRRILYAMFRMDDGKYHKVANIIGDTMKFHPHGDASIGGALVVLANKELFIDKQGNFGNLLTGDPASAARYIEARLTPFAHEVLFNPELTEMVDSYDGRNKEPVVLPCKIPAVLLLGTDGIAVGMSTSILPHNFQEVLQAQIAYLKGQEFELYPDFHSGGEMDVSAYDRGNGKVRVRAHIEKVDEKTLVIREVPYGVTTASMIQSIQDAVNRGRLKINSVQDYTTDKVEIEIKVTRGVSVESLIKPLYALTNCEVSLSVNMLVIQNNGPVLMNTQSVLKYNTDRLLIILEKEILLDLSKTRQKHHVKLLEILFIQHKVYKHLENSESYEEATQKVTDGMNHFEKQLGGKVSEEDIEKLLNIPIKRISKFDLQKGQVELEQLTETIARLENLLKDIRAYAIEYLQKILKKHGSSFKRRTRLVEFEDISLKEVLKEDLKVVWDAKEGYLGYELKGDPIAVCSSYDRLVLFYENGSYKIIRVPEKLFIGMEVVRVDKLDSERIYNLIYYQNYEKIAYIKRFCVKNFILDKVYRLFEENKGAKVIYFGEGAGKLIEVKYVPAPRLKKTLEVIELDQYAVKGIGSKGNRISIKPVQKVRETKEAKIHKTAEQLPLITDDGND